MPTEPEVHLEESNIYAGRLSTQMTSLYMGGHLPTEQASWKLLKLKTQKRKLLKTQAKLLKREEGSESNVCPSTGAGMCVPSYCQFPFSDLGTMAQIPVSSDIQACRRQTVGLLHKDLRINQFHLDIWSVYRMCMCLHIECIYVSVLEYYF